MKKLNDITPSSPPTGAGAQCVSACAGCGASLKLDLPCSGAPCIDLCDECAAYYEMTDPHAAMQGDGDEDLPEPEVAGGRRPD